MNTDLQFQLVSPHQPAGDQPQAIAALVEGLRAAANTTILHGITGSGKTRTMAGVIQAVQRPTLVMSHNKTLASQLYGEFRGTFPHNAVQVLHQRLPVLLAPDLPAADGSSITTNGRCSTRC